MAGNQEHQLKACVGVTHGWQNYLQTLENFAQFSINAGFKVALQSNYVLLCELSSTQ